MSNEEIWLAIVAAIGEETDNPMLAISPEMTALDVPGWDSLAHARILLNIDIRLGVTVDIEASYRVATLGGLISIVKRSLPA
jgi:acyl carrier protein